MVDRRVQADPGWGGNTLGGPVNEDRTKWMWVELEPYRDSR